MPHYLTIHFSAKSSESRARLVLMHANEGIVNKVDKDQMKTLLAACDSADFSGESGQFLPVHSVHGPVLIAGIGKGIDTGQSAETWGGRLFAQMKLAPFNLLQIDADLLPAEIVPSVLCGALSASYYFDQYFTVKKPDKIAAELHVTSANKTKLSRSWSQFKALVAGVFTARDLLYEPANVLYPKEFARRCAELESVGLDVQIIPEKELETLGMGALLGVGQGSCRDSAVVVMNWRGGSDEDAPAAGAFTAHRRKKRVLILQL